MEQKKHLLVASSLDGLEALLDADDFIIVGGNIDITKDGLLKLLATIRSYRIAFELISITAEQVVVKAVIETDERRAEGMGVATRTEILERRKTNPRAEHDMVALAETRATKRAIEWLLGTAVINSAVKRLMREGKLPSDEHDGGPALQQAQQAQKQIHQQIQAQEQKQIQQQMQAQPPQKPTQTQQLSKVAVFTERNEFLLSKIFSQDELLMLKALNWQEWVDTTRERIKQVFQVDLRTEKPSELIRMLEKIIDAEEGELLDDTMDKTMEEEKEGEYV